MRESQSFPVHQAALAVDIVGSEIVLSGMVSLSPSFSAASARETAKRLIHAADELEGSMIR